VDTFRSSHRVCRTRDSHLIDDTWPRPLPHTQAPDRPRAYGFPPHRRRARARGTCFAPVWNATPNTLPPYRHDSGAAGQTSVEERSAASGFAGTWLGALGRGVCGGSRVREGSGTCGSGGTQACPRAFSAWGLTPPVTSTLTWVALRPSCVKNPRVENGHLKDEKSSPPCMRGRPPAYAVMSSSRAGTAGRTASVPAASRRLTNSRPTRSLIAFPRAEARPEDVMMGEDGTRVVGQPSLDYSHVTLARESLAHLAHHTRGTSSEWLCKGPCRSLIVEPPGQSECDS